MASLVLVRRDDIEGRILWIRLNRGDKLNALNLEMLNELHDGLVSADVDESIHAVIITGSERSFSVGADLEEISKLSLEDGIRWFTAYWGIIDLVRNMGKPVIAAVRGYCVGGGHELAMACDLVVAGRSSRFGQPEIRVGSTAMGLGIQLLPLLVGEKRARELLFTGRLISAEEAYSMGLINRVVDDDVVEDEARKLALEVINNASPQAFRVMKSALGFWTNLAMINLQLARDVTAMVWTSEEFRERANDFLEKRAMRRGKFMGITPRRRKEF